MQKKVIMNMQAERSLEKVGFLFDLFFEILFCSLVTLACFCTLLCASEEICAYLCAAERLNLPYTPLATVRQVMG